MKYYTRKEAAAYLQAMGLKYSPATLAKLACLGGGPVYQRFGNRSVYTSENLDRWIDSKLSAPRSFAGEAA